MHALLSQGENQDQIGKPVRPGGRKREKEDGERTPCILWKEEVKDRWKTSQTHQLRYFPLQDGHCHSPASLLGKENTGMWGVIPKGEGTQRWLGFPCPFPLFYKLQQDLAGLCLSSLPWAAGKTSWHLTTGRVETVGEESPYQFLCFGCPQGNSSSISCIVLGACFLQRDTR